VVESPQGAPTKNKYDPETGTFELSRPLPKGFTYPFDWGFIPSTKGSDGDPLDLMVVHDAPTFPGIVIGCHLIGVLEVRQDEEKGKRIRNDRMFAVPVESPREDRVNHVHDLPKRLRSELERFFLASAQLEGKNLEVLGWKGPEVAERLIHEGQSAFRKNGGG
jgi:inorganic pyrophosphatase